MRFLVTALVLIFVTACVPNDKSREEIVLHGKTMGTTYNIKAIKGSSSVTKQELQKQVDDALLGVNKAMSNWDKNSEISRFNRSESTAWTPISRDFGIVMQEALRIHNLTGGYFDVTLAPIIELWGFGTKQDTPPQPSQREIREALESVGMSTMIEFEIDPPALRKVNTDTTVNLSAIAKGFGIDKVASVLEQDGINDYLVEIGGDLVTKGNNSKGEPWVVGIEKPDSSTRAVQQVVRVSNKGLATSGDYRIYKEINGKRFSHIIDAATGRPVTHKLASVTVIADNATRADGLATALLAMGDKRGMALAEREGIAAFFIVRDNDRFITRSSSAFRKIEQSAEK
ncbi:Thiamine biosynthesis lipoprotein ApbE precursor [Pseudovibrio axinellae]|uniref:FAD:protein FMN transferase n=1 Tax=Pseudovibrio axinellae TaxID=989403 RepID=A0A165T052_9HYPH|nr:FAD:protein FMN transferase [Pseudovibrio axinellae]KZL05112.1 Thiamine biosynthesis lipoprotein ApbE precursor [Pseudovibrio axinellae]SER48675.1 thiamine biosynthesis lipoprotein [Pseudovibrio axinellae]